MDERAGHDVDSDEREFVMKKKYGPSWSWCTGLGVVLLAACGGAGGQSHGLEPSSMRPQTDRPAPTGVEPGTAHDDVPLLDAVDERLVEAAKEGHWLSIIHAMDDGADGEGLVGVAGITDLHIACLGGDLERVEQLVEQGADVSAKTNRNETPLHLAALSGAVSVLSFLVDRGADMSAVDYDDRSVLHWAILGGWVEIVKYLVNVQSVPATFDPSGVYPPLVASISSGNIDTVKFLVLKGADATLADSDGITPLHHAAESNELDIATFLVSKGAKASAKDDAGKTSLHSLAMSCPTGESCLTLAKFLVKKGAKKGSVDADGKTAGDYAAERGDMEMGSFLGNGK
jgi:ankyrin repeat protein